MFIYTYSWLEIQNNYLPSDQSCWIYSKLIDCVYVSLLLKWPIDIARLICYPAYFWFLGCPPPINPIFERVKGVLEPLLSVSFHRFDERKKSFSIAAMAVGINIVADNFRNENSSSRIDRNLNHTSTSIALTVLQLMLHPSQYDL